jgi:hypothetical protein
VATKTEVLLIDDLDGSKAESTVTFGLDGKHYEIDLSKKNAKNLREALNIFVEHGRVISGRRPKAVTKSASAAKKTTAKAPAKVSGSTTEIREWAKTKGIPVGDRGRIPAHIVEQFEADRRVTFKEPADA